MDESPIRLPGFILQRVRERAGYSRNDFAKYLKGKKTTWKGVGSRDSLYRLELQKMVEPRYVRHLKEFISPPVFDQLLAELKEEYPDEFKTSP